MFTKLGNGLKNPETQRKIAQACGKLVALAATLVATSVIETGIEKGIDILFDKIQDNMKKPSA